VITISTQVCTTPFAPNPPITFFVSYHTIPYLTLAFNSSKTRYVFVFLFGLSLAIRRRHSVCVTAPDTVAYRQGQIFYVFISILLLINLLGHFVSILLLVGLLC
jgi:hypothetical protein